MLEYNINNIQKPFLKWVGGKTQIIKNILDIIPYEIENYHELFVGGGSVLLAILSLQKNNNIIIKDKIYAYDINKNLINLYKDIQNNKDELFKFIQIHTNIYDKLTGNTINRKPLNIEEAYTSKESYYYWVRNKFNTMDKDTIEHSAIFLFLNKTCFRGIYREGPNGFNVPYGHYKTTPSIIKKIDLDNISYLIKDVIFIHSDFNTSINKIKENDFVYLDPPYFQENSKSFVGYDKSGFNLETHKQLFNHIIELDKNNIKFILSNSYVDFVVEYFKNFNQEKINARRAINSKNPASIVNEIMVFNY